MGVVKNACNFTGTPVILFMALVAKVYCVQNVEMLFQRQLKNYKTILCNGINKIIQR